MMLARLKFSSFAVTTLAAYLLLFAGPSFAQHYTRTDLTADMAATSPSAPNLDPNLINAWGLARGSATPFWVSDNGKGLSTLYNGSGVPQALVVKIPTADGSGDSAPTGAIFNYTKEFEVTAGNAAVFLFCTEDGTIAAWSPAVDRNNAVVKFPPAGKTSKAIYKGCALAASNNGVFLYATNFVTGKVDVFNSSFKLVRSLHLDFESDDDQGRRHDNDSRNFVPFGIQNIGGNLVVTFAKRTPGSEDEQHGPGLGAVAIYDGNGRLLSRLQRGNFLNAPWGIALAPGDFGPFSHRLLIGNFGDGSINAFNTITGRFEGKLLNPDGSNLSVDGLWALSFGGDTANNGSATSLFFTAGPNDESGGLFGMITATASEQRGNAE